MSAPRLASQGAVWVGALIREGVPILSGYAVRRIEGHDRPTRVVVAPVAADHAPGTGADRAFDCDAVCYGFGLQPATEITRLLGADHHFVPGIGGWVPVVSADGATTSVPKLYVCGDGAGVSADLDACLG